MTKHQEALNARLKTFFDQNHLAASFNRLVLIENQALQSQMHWFESCRLLGFFSRFLFLS